MQLLRQLATRYHQVWLSLWALVVIMGSLVPCCESLATTSPESGVAHIDVGGLHQASSHFHGDTLSAERGVCETVLANIDSSPALLASQNSLNPEPFKTLLVGGLFELVLSAARDTPVRFQALPLHQHQSVYLITQRLRI